MLTALSLLIVMNAPSAPANSPFLSPTFGDHMVLQRDKPNTFWGWTTPGEKVQVEIAGKKATGRAEADGRWSVRIKPPAVGGPYTVTVRGPETVVLNDVLVGDVWICSGQSNMEMGLTAVDHGQEDAVAANDPELRVFMAERQVGFVPHRSNDGQWKICTPTAVAQGGWGGFSAVGYHFGKELRERLKVPIGLIQAAWGGTSAEAWVSREGLAKFGDFDPQLADLEGRINRHEPALGTYTGLWLMDHDLGSRPGSHWEAEGLDDSDWTLTTLQDGPRAVGAADTGSVIWYRTSITLPDPLPEGMVTLSLGEIRLDDWVWANGKPVGNGSGQYPRIYQLWPGSLRPGKNELAIRALSPEAHGGFVSSPATQYLDLSNDQRVKLDGPWRAKLGFAIAEGTAKPHDTNPNPSVPTTLYNGMIAPIAPLAVRGAIWYQGETNSGRGEQYQRLLPALIADWRKQFGRQEIPFYIVSLAAFQPRKTEAGDDYWAELREAQALTAQKVKRSGLAITIDVGDAADVHPRDKTTVGHRLALNALALEYGLEIPYSGPVYRSLTVEGSSIRVHFDHTNGGLTAKGGKLEEFSVAGADRKWHWAEAKIDGDTVVVSSTEVAKPVAVRYAWQSNPAATLYNAAGLPAVPFRSDRWKLLSAGQK
jgi:sialate O-acetylesterase